MKITSWGDTTIFDGKGDLVLTTNECALEVGSYVGSMSVNNWCFYCVKRHRLEATIAALKFIWGKV